MSDSNDTAYYLLDATVRENYDALDRQTFDCGQQCKDTFDDLCAAVARCAEARGYDRGFLAGSIESVEERSRFGIERDALRETVREWALMRQDRDELLAERDALRETVARLTRDGERLDWLESKGCIDIDVWRRGAGSSLVWSLYQTKEYREVFGAPSLRAAIDAARRTPTDTERNDD